ncbi:BTB/POZ domain-containing protein At3g05675-like [Dioscorea cayenensis subsp. rotundata]|uniref:BTB/POZ domain-containing protein At3g05675-like n=1 Tax=Dioscorea cayennensis subsp. rotundata TaxID=55577 RepID=A0AB40CVG7_DIOCR|nr:BTB/POZ domain-containing protein At3g05675-like [Dioscorea cayenensis subsp. rotundata]
MDKTSIEQTSEFGDQSTSDVTVCLRSRDGMPELFYCHSSILKQKSGFFAEQLISDNTSPKNYIEVKCQGSEYDHYAKLLKLLYLSEDLILDSWDAVKTALGVLRASIALQCEGITNSCIQYLEAVPWEEKEEEEILKITPALGTAATALLARIRPVNENAAKNVFLSAIHFATTAESSFPLYADELKTSAQEQVEYMLVEDEDTPLVILDEDVRSEVRTGLARVFTRFEGELNTLNIFFDLSPQEAEERMLQCLSDIDWMCNILPKMEMMKDFISNWIGISAHMLAIIQADAYCSGLWAVKAKLIELAGKAFDAVGYGSVVLPAPSRLHFLKTWLPYMRKMKPILDSQSEGDDSFPHKMDTDQCQNIEGAIISLVLALPSNDQAEILGDWMKMAEKVKFPDLSEAFEVWCYRTKTAKRRLMVGLNGVGNPTVTL